MLDRIKKASFVEIRKNMHTIYPASYTLVGTFQTFTGGISNIKVANVATLQTVASYIKGENVLC